MISGTTLKKSILEELPIRDAISLRENDWFSELVNSDDKLEMVVEYFRAASLYVLNELILKYGQDMKNNQWILEPYANMLCSLAIVDTGFKRLQKMNHDSSRLENMEIFELSVSQQYVKLNQEMDKILLHVSKNKEDYLEKSKKINNYRAKLNYYPDEIDLMNKVVNTFYRHGKYYLD